MLILIFFSFLFSLSIQTVINNTASLGTILSSETYLDIDLEYIIIF